MPPIFATHFDAAIERRYAAAGYGRLRPPPLRALITPLRRLLRCFDADDYAITLDAMMLTMPYVADS